MPDSRTLDALNERFAIPGVARFEAGAGGMAHAAITAPAAEAHVYLHGAHVTHHQPTGQAPLLFLSARSRFDAQASIRGGVPIVFPWFGARAAAPDHGFARTSEWTVESVERAGRGVAIALSLGPTAAGRAFWPHDFLLTYRVTIETALELDLAVENRSDTSFTFEEALHSYLQVGDVAQVALSGLGGAGYVDKTDGMKRKTLGPDPFRLDGETDRVFPGAGGDCVVVDPVLRRRLSVDKRGSATTVVWNPWSDKGSHMADLGPDQWRSMLCVETANAMDDAVELAPGARHSMAVAIRAA